MQPDQGPIVVEFYTQPAITPDIGVEVVLSMFALAGVMLLFAAVGGVVVGAVVVGFRRFRESSAPLPPDARSRGLGL
ncbi:MAG: hypothetical protein O2930_01170 [Acidobacteria bacterium]|nr:hypothetical protein [Acidobacteriota bacterium]